MHTPAEWHATTSLNMTQAKTSNFAASQQVNTSKRAHEETVVNNLAMYDTMQKTLDQKVRTSQRMVEKLTNRQHSLENSVQATKGSLAMLEKALADKDAPMQLCLWRLEQREKRPLREQVRDVVEIGLEDEKTALVETQRRLAEGLKRTKACIHDLNEMLDEVRHDIEHKVHALTVDESCLRSTERSKQAVLDRTPPPPNSARTPRGSGVMSPKSARHQIALQESASNEVRRQQRAERLCREAAAREEAAKALREENQKLANRMEAAAFEAGSKTDKRLQDRITENQQVRRRLENELRETNAGIQKTKQTIAETRYQIKALDEPIDLTNTCASWRQQRATKEHIQDPVTHAISNHRATVLTHQQELLSHHQQEKTHLKELIDRRDRLKEDLKDKQAAVQIDMTCLTHEALRNMKGLGESRHVRTYGRSKSVSR